VIADGQIEVLYSANNPDYKPFHTPYGTAFSGQYNFENGLFLSGYYTDNAFFPSGPYAGNNKVKTWSEIGIGFAFSDDYFSADKGTFYSLITSEIVDLETGSKNGFGAHFGYLYDFSDRWKGVIQLGRIETDFYDWQLIGKLYYKISDQFQLTFHLRDYDKWDYTNYEAGIVYHF